MKLNSVQCGDTIFVFDDASQQKVDKMINAKLEQGYSLHVDAITRQFITYDVITIDGKHIWDKSGNRCKHNKVRHTTRPGEHTEKIIGTSYRNF